MVFYLLCFETTNVRAVNLVNVLDDMCKKIFKMRKCESFKVT